MSRPPGPARKRARGSAMSEFWRQEEWVYRGVFLGLALVPQPAFGFAAVQILWSIGCYPIIVGASRLVIDLRKPATGEIDDYGRRL